MIRIDQNTVELTIEERAISEHFEQLLDKGWNIPIAVATLQGLYPPNFSDEFWAWLGGLPVCYYCGESVTDDPEGEYVKVGVNGIAHQSCVSERE